MGVSDLAAAAGRGVLSAKTPAEGFGEQAGGKAKGLYDLSAAGIPVPAWAVVSVEAFQRFRGVAGLDAIIVHELEGLGPEASEEELVQAEARIQAAILGTELDDGVRETIEQAYALAGGGPVAVRSSAIGEDGTELSFAGQHRTLLNVIGSNPVAEAVRACWASAWAADALRYRLTNKLPLSRIEMAVVIQEIVASEVSGVLFTINPATGSEDEFVLSAAYGLGEAVVSGTVDPDTVILDRGSGGVRDQTLGAKEERIDALPDGGCETDAVPWSERIEPALSAAQLRVLHDYGLKLEELMGSPQDIEWAFVEDQLWILQSRPVTSRRRVAEPAGELRLWDNSNIIESYGDIVAPLTYSFARHAYHRVYQQYCQLLGIPKRQLKVIEEWLPQLLGYFDGRVYYNLLNWYRLARLIPFYSVNRRVLEMSMGADPLEEKIADGQQPYVFRNRMEGVLVRGRVAAHFFWYFGTIHRLVRSFVDRFYQDYDELNALEYEGREAPEIYSMFIDMERRLLVRWGRMIMLEYSVGLSIGTLYGLTQRWLPDSPEWFLFDAVKTPDAESVEPMRRLDELAEAVAGHPELLARVLSEPAEHLNSIFREAQIAPTRSLVERLDAYLDEFGYRNANDLKLEEPDLREDPASFFTLLKSAIGRLEVTDATARQERPTADEYLAAHLGGWRRRIFELQRRRAQRVLADREQVRFCRSRIFGLSRRMFRAVGTDLARSGVLEEAGDIFYLRLEELRGCFEGTIAHRELAPLVALRKEQELRNRELELPHRFWTRGGVYWEALDRACAEASKEDLPADGQLRGTPCSPGIVRGEARVSDRPVDVGGGVLVTYRTDPGWVGALRSASALLIERGSPLTHVAVVARELGIPTVVQIPGLTQQVRTGMEVMVDGTNGTIDLVSAEDRSGTER
ncbi:MAG: phosphoenolpyruvate synthase [Solirubrobacterales bacterium]